MKLRTISIVLAFLFILGVNALALNLSKSFSNDQSVYSLGGEPWPQPILDAINSHSRVYGFSIDGGGTFHFVGKTDEVNSFLQQIAADKESILNVALSPEVGKATPNVSDYAHADLKANCAWSLDLYYNHQPYQFPPSDEKLPNYTATVTIYCGGTIDPAALKLPLRFHASVGGRLADFVDLHNADRADLEKQGTSLDTATPTVESDLDTRSTSVFGGSTTQPTNSK